MTTIREVLHTHHAEILGRWAERVRKEAFAEGLSPSELVGVIPEYLSLLGGNNGLESAELARPQREIVERHVSNRLRQGSTLNEILTEFSSLSSCITAALESDTAVERLSARQAASLFSELSVTCVAVMKIFNEHLLEDEQPEKRFVRLLQKISADGLNVDSAAGDLKRRLEEALALITRAMEAHTAALLLFDARSDGLLMSASAGEADQPLERYVRSLDLATFAGRVAPARSATAVTDAAVTELEVSDRLRSSGIQSLLAVRLSSGHTLRGVLYIGVREDRAFSPSEIRRIENLGEALTIHLDNAQLNAALRAKFKEVTAECQLRERFVSVLTHDLNRPLMAAKLLGQQLLQASIPEAQGIATSIIQHLDQIEEIVARLADAQRVRAGTAVPDQQHPGL